jgi:hypothetical protein
LRVLKSQRLSSRGELAELAISLVLKTSARNGLGV